ncbi:isochorismate synthase [Vagococcus zengguangii]|uniref:isochorismate synthase n=1 Tax=Vagococcus zengguangii TaxID=2571750 RepID=A0A4D7CUQ5_9ENTE|nr:isochorismate synthase [Vagococcus zengguangii]QCI85896.1 isochorismate synthase [Vagococcus zengguangii]TLG78386.1 isochorismate synthase [Vagococcus zengguangii]
MMIPSQLLTTPKHDYYSWVMPLDCTDSPLTFYKKITNDQLKPNMYWETPDQTTQFCAWGAEMLLSEAQASLTKIKQLPTNSSIFEGSDLDQKIEATGCLLVGGFSFDQADCQPADTWGELAQGYFFIPTFIITNHEEQTYLTINIKHDDHTSLADAWQQRIASFEHLVAQVLTDSPVVTQVETEEVATQAWVSLVEETVNEIKTQPALTKVVLARETAVEQDQVFEPAQIVARLKQQQAATYFFSLSSGEHTFIGATPERLLKATAKQLVTASIAGSTPRGTTELEDQQLGEALLNDQKNRKEHLIVVQRIIKDLENITQTEIHAHEPVLLKNRDIQHLHLPIIAQRSEATRFLDVVEQLHPTPALGGEPKALALEWLRKNEPLNRGLYGAPIGWYQPTTDQGEFAVGIRSGVFHGETGRLFAGCGIVADSQAELERIETKVKFRPMLRGIGGQLDDTSK